MLIVYWEHGKITNYEWIVVKLIIDKIMPTHLIRTGYRVMKCFLYENASNGKKKKGNYNFSSNEYTKWPASKSTRFLFQGHKNNNYDRYKILGEKLYWKKVYLSSIFNLLSHIECKIM